MDCRALNSELISLILSFCTVQYEDDNEYPDSDTLRSCLLVNKTFFLLTAPYLYKRASTPNISNLFSGAINHLPPKLFEDLCLDRTISTRSLYEKLSESMRLGNTKLPLLLHLKHLIIQPPYSSLDSSREEYDAIRLDEDKIHHSCMRGLRTAASRKLDILPKIQTICFKPHNDLNWNTRKLRDMSIAWNDYENRMKGLKPSLLDFHDRSSEEYHIRQSRSTGESLLGVSNEILSPDGLPPKAWGDRNTISILSSFFRRAYNQGDDAPIRDLVSWICKSRLAFEVDKKVEDLMEIPMTVIEIYGLERYIPAVRRYDGNELSEEKMREQREKGERLKKGVQERLDSLMEERTKLNKDTKLVGLKLLSLSDWPACEACE
ncbi:hypothetical protein I302_102589 [Kwoniella bestiolae CBS 10118]|uniref:Uncharacterized protein n=1 Tax=Kwoniella bestiolae CBS 10118 TaxID=1296100 RepID=A0A1B9GFE1_9TREE|nr:hypothetical protein I302_01276 [Kwoniella bestiolae CBS 10118]OCF29763.1 hypothetical protein I302_01276 [Kwoniella bestiolae CBS 10118]